MHLLDLADVYVTSRKKENEGEGAGYEHSSGQDDDETNTSRVKCSVSHKCVPKTSSMKRASGVSKTDGCRNKGGNE